VNVLPGQDRLGEDNSSQVSRARLLTDHDVLWLCAPNPGPLTLSGTNTWVVGRGPAWVVDPGPLLDDHVAEVLAAVGDRGGLGGIVLTHDHSDHSAAVQALLDRHAAPVAAGRGDVELRLEEDLRFGPFQAVATPGHAIDHFALVANGACFTGDAVLGEGSVFIAPYPGAMRAYLRALERLLARTDLRVICPGHGPPVWDVTDKLREYVEHRRDRERELVRSLERGRRGEQELLDAVWWDVPGALRPVAAVTLAAHLDKLDEEGRLPTGVQRPDVQAFDW
jgi:glyoxylase-like metal-dependent hydrolase (beta-lactamase superfamily II)